MPKNPRKKYDTPVKNNLEAGITILTKPKLKWLTIQRLGTLGGGLNAGIATVRFQNDPLNRVFIEKTFKPVDVKERTAHKEITLLKQVGDHMHITSMYDHFIHEESRTSCVYMELCDKGSLADVIMNGDGGGGRGLKWINEHKIWAWLLQILDALVYCHLGPNPEVETETLNWATIYHRDVKPGNILLTRDQTKSRLIAKLADFGCAISDEWAFQTKDMSTAAHASAQTPGFDPPEFPTYSGASDVWQLALVFVCVCTGKKASPQSRMNPRGEPWDRQRPAGDRYSRDLSYALQSCLLEDSAQRPGALKSFKSISAAYSRVHENLRADVQPLEIFEPARSGESGIAEVFTSSDGSGQQFLGLGDRHPMAYLHSRPFFPRPRLPGYVLSNPEVQRAERMPYNYMDYENGPVTPQDAFAEGQYPSGAIYPQDSREYENGLGQAYLPALDPELARVPYRHHGFFPPLHPRHPHFRRDF